MCIKYSDGRNLTMDKFQSEKKQLELDFHENRRTNEKMLSFHSPFVLIFVRRIVSWPIVPTDFPAHPVYGGEIRARHTHGARDTRASYVNNAGIRTVAIQFSTCSGSVSPPRGKRFTGSACHNVATCLNAIADRAVNRRGPLNNFAIVRAYKARPQAFRSKERERERENRSAYR